MKLGDAMRQKTIQLELPLGNEGEAHRAQRSVEASTARHGTERSRNHRMMEQAVEYGNLREAVKRVKKNKGSPGIDGMEVEELESWLEENWEKTPRRTPGGNLPTTSHQANGNPENRRRETTIGNPDRGRSDDPTADPPKPTTGV